MTDRIQQAIEALESKESKVSECVSLLHELCYSTIWCTCLRESSCGYIPS